MRQVAPLLAPVFSPGASHFCDHKFGTNPRPKHYPAALGVPRQVQENGEPELTREAEIRGLWTVDGLTFVIHWKLYHESRTV